MWSEDPHVRHSFDLLADLLGLAAPAGLSIARTSAGRRALLLKRLCDLAPDTFWFLNGTFGAAAFPNFRAAGGFKMRDFTGVSAAFCLL